MKAIEQIIILKKDGEIHKHFNSAGKELESTTQTLIEGCLDNYPYQNLLDVKTAFKIELKLKVEDNKINLEDSEFDFIKAKIESFVPYLQGGLVFMPFFKLFER